MRGMLFILLLHLFQFTVCGQSVPGAVVYSGGTYNQNFDGLPSSGTFALTGKGPFSISSAPVNAATLGGWQFLMVSGTGSSAAFGISTGSSTANSVYSLGGSGSTDRSLGTLAAGAGIYGIGLLLTNQTNGILNSFTISFTAEQWRKGGSTVKNIWSFRYATGVLSSIDPSNLVSEPHLNFGSVITTTGAAALDGNQPANQQIISYTVTGIIWKPGEQLALRWDDADETGNDDAMGIDNFSFSASLTSSVPSVVNAVVNGIGSDSALIGGIVNDNYSGTHVSVQYDTSIVFSNAVSVIPLFNFIIAGSGNTAVNANMNGLISGRTYYARIKAENNNGTVYGAVQTFTTLIDPPVITALAVSGIATVTAVLSANLSKEGGAVVTEKGFVWSLNNNPGLQDHKIIVGTGAGIFSGLIDNLPQATMIYAKAYAVNAGGTTYTGSIQFSTQTLVTSITPLSAQKTNASSVDFLCTTSQNITGLHAANFSISATGIANAAVGSVTGSAKSFTISVSSGTGDGILQLRLSNDTMIVPAIYNKPYTATGYYVIDKTPPSIQKISIADRSMKTGDTIPVQIFVYPDADLFTMVSGKIDGFNLSGFTKQNDSIYNAYFIIANGGNDVVASADIPVSVILQDQVGNRNTAYQVPIIQSNDGIDANKPFIISAAAPPDKTYKLNDTLTFSIRFSENIIVNTTNGIPAISVTVGTKTKTASYTSGTNSNTLLFRYVVQSNDVDTDGIKTAGVITLNNAEIKDGAGNIAITTINNMPSLAHILVDGSVAAVQNVFVPSDKTYTAGDSLYFTVIFTDTVFVTQKNDTPFIKLTIGSASKNINYSSGSGSMNLLFAYEIKKGDLDKNGISLGTVVNITNTIIFNRSGNPANLTLKNPAPLANIKIDAVGPVFTKATDTISLCENTNIIFPAVSTAVTDDDIGEPVNWKIITAPVNGRVILPDTILLSGAKSISLNGVGYQPYNNHILTDSLVIQASDGWNNSQKKIFISFLPAIKNNLVSAPALMCMSAANPVAGTLPTGGNNSYQYAWESASDSISFSKANGTNSLQQYAPSLSGTAMWFRRKVISGLCIDTSTGIKITILTTGLWNGAADHNWNNENNWCGNTIPGNTTDVYVYQNGSNNPVVTDSAKCNQLILSPGTSLNINGILQLNNLLYASGNIDAKNGTVLFTGNVPQPLGGSMFRDQLIKNIVINNAYGVKVTDPLLLSGTLVINNGSLATNNNLYLKQSASIGACASGISVTGDVYLEHLVNGGKKSFILLGNPFNQALSLDMIKDSIDITGNGGAVNGFVSTATNEPSAFFLDPVSGNDSSGINAGWKPFTSTNGIDDNAWKPYRGIRLLMRGEPGQGMDATPAGDGSSGTYLPQPVVLAFHGVINTGTKETILLNDAHGGYNLVSNPYVSNIDLSRVTKGTNLGNAYWIWDPQQGKHGGYTGILSRSRYILPALGAFIVKANANIHNSLLFTENCKTNAFANDTIAAAVLDDLFFVDLRLESDSIFYDRLLILASDSAKAGPDNNDAEKLINDDVNFYSLDSKNKMLSIDSRPLNNSVNIPLGLQTNTEGIFRIRVASAKLPSSHTLMLHDIYLNQWMHLEKDSAYTFSVSHDTTGLANARFEITTPGKNPDTVFDQPGIIARVWPVPSRDKIVLQFNSPEKGNTTIRLLSLSGKVLKIISPGIQKEGKFIIPVSELANGIYIIELRCGIYTSTQKIIKN